MESVTLELDETTINRIDEAVAQGHWHSRDHFIRDTINDFQKRQASIEQHFGNRIGLDVVPGRDIDFGPIGSDER